MRILSGIQPSGQLHIGNYFGMIKRMIELQEKQDLFAFIANYHALTSLSDGEALRQNTLDAAINFFALGIDPEKSTFWVQSDVPEVLELYWILSNYTSMGLLERGHSYKDKVAKGIAANHGLFSYPVLMAADIILFDSDVVPVGKDQIQHVEMTRDIVQRFNHHFNDEVFKMPEYSVDDNVAAVPGVDGAKMSKSYKNTIDMFNTQKQLKKQVNSIVTDSTPLEEPKEYEECNVYALCKLFMDDNELTTLQNRYKSGGEGYGHFKKDLITKIWDHFEDHREKHEYLTNHEDDVRMMLEIGAKKARLVAREKMEKIRSLTGIRY